MRELVFDTETTGFYADNGDRLIEIGMIELVDRKITGNNLHLYFNPEREVSKEAVDVHKLTDEFLSDKPKFADKAKEVMNYIGTDSILIAHNASFDMSFLNMELTKSGLDPIDKDRFVDTLLLSRKKYPQYTKHSLDAICNRLDISLSEREKNGHGALLDAMLLVKVYFNLTDKKELDLGDDLNEKQMLKQNLSQIYGGPIKHFCVVEPTVEESIEHEKLVESLTNPIWKSSNKYDFNGTN